MRCFHKERGDKEEGGKKVLGSGCDGPLMWVLKIKDLGLKKKIFQEFNIIQ